MKEKHSESRYMTNLRPVILAEARRCFCERGIRAVKMDEIAQRLGISKRTIYELFATKEAILVEVLQKILDDRAAYFADFSDNCDNVFDLLLEVLRRQLEFSSQTHTSFFSDMQRYPKVQKVFDKCLAEQSSKSKDFFIRGVKQGYFRTDIDYDVFLKVSGDAMKMVRTQPSFQGIPHKALLLNFLCVIIRGISTEKGMKRIDDFAKKYTETSV